MSDNAVTPGSEADPSLTTCLNCRTPMPRELRFCRNCGFRLGEGSAEYTETVRFQDGRPSVVSANSPGSQPFATSYGLSGGGMAADRSLGKRRKKISGMTWMFLGLLAFFLAAAIFTSLVTQVRRGFNTEITKPAATRSWVGVESFYTAEGGVTFASVEPPGSPADKAGLVGGDLITTFDGHRVSSDDEIMDLLGETPVGKTVDVVFIRDGEEKTTKLTTVSKTEFDRLARDFRNRPEGRGRFGFDDDDTERVPIPGTKMFGVRLDDVSASLPADMAGIKEGDVVIEFDGAPIRTPEELSSRVVRAVPYSTIKVVVMRGTEKLEIPVKMGRQ